MAASDNVLNNIQAYGGQMQSPEQLIQNEGSQVGLQQSQQNVAGLRGAISQTSNLLNQVAPQVMGDSLGSLTTSAQAGRIAQNAQAPLQDTLSRNVQAFGNANQDLGRLQHQVDTKVDANLGFQKNQMDYLHQLYKDYSDKEQQAAKEAENRREFDISESLKRQAAAKAQASARSGGGSSGGGRGRSGGGGSSGGGGHPTIAQVIQGYIQAPSDFGPYNPHDTNNHRWQEAADYLSNLGYDVTRGSAADKQLRAAFDRKGK